MEQTMPAKINFTLRPIAVVRSPLKHRRDAPRQGREGAPDVWLEVAPKFAKALHGVIVGQELIVITWLHRANRSTLRVHPRSDKNLPLTGVFATRSPDRPNPLGLHHVTVREIAATKFKVGPVEAIDGTPIVDIKPILCP
jgi:tRNA-Thr(GGU) m(6)t(6)A37 methyltransferase TsaA